jgi:ATP-dependent phosphofructokinase / diphosphate-dependent phosphofructokinase
VRLGLLTSGGDCPGLNAAIRAVVRRAERGYGFEVLGIEDAGRGLIERRTVPLTVAGLDQDGYDPYLSSGGTLLGSINRSTGYAESELHAGYRDLGLDALVAIGGDGSLAILYGQAQRGGWSMVGIPKTIDNDVALTDRAIGFESAVRTVARAVADLRTTAVSHDRVLVLETMGREAGHLALHGGMAGGADVILLPEIPFTVDGVMEAVERRRHMRGQAFALVVVAEGITPPAIDVDPASSTAPRGPGEILAHALHTASKGTFEVRTTVLGHLQRGGSPTPSDVLLATSFGVHAVDLVARGSFGRMVAFRGSDTVIDVAIPDVVAAGSSPVRLDDPLVQVARSMGVYVGQD